MRGGASWSARRVLVTGASGFIGSALTGRLIREGAAVHAVARRPPSEEESAPGTTWHAGDLSDPGFARETLLSACPTHVFHLASHVSGAQGVDQVLPTFQANLASTVNLIVAAAETAPRFVAAGSLVEPVPGSAGATPSSPYAAAKWASGSYLRMAHALYGLPATIARIFMVYGPGQRDTTKLVPYAALAALRGEAPRCGSGDRRVDWVHVEDVVGGLLALADSEASVGRTVDVGTGMLTSIRDVVEQIVRCAGSSAAPEFGARPDPKLEPVEVADADETERLVGWRAEIVLAKGLADTVAWYESHHPRERA